VRLVARVAAREATVGGETIPAGRRVTAWIGSANRDESRFPDAARFDPARQPNSHLAFGHGIHYCLGAPLARLEARVALTAMLARLERPAIVADVPLRPVRGLFLHGVASLPLRFTPRPAS
jgi:cytochrome P450